MIEMWQLKKLRFIFNMWTVYVQSMLKAKKYLNRLFSKNLTYNMMKKFKRWREHAALKQMSELRK